MKSIKIFLINHPLVGKVIIFPFSMLLTATIFSLLIDFILPLLLALLLTNLLYHIFIDDMKNKDLYNPLSYIYTRYN